jgi:hypothetical protein
VRLAESGAEFSEVGRTEVRLLCAERRTDVRPTSERVVTPFCRVQ